MKLIIDIPEEDYKGICHLNNEQLRMLPVEVAETLIRIANGTPIPDNATNGQIIQTLFKPNRAERTDDVIVENYDFSKEWWNAQYQKGGKNER